MLTLRIIPCLDVKDGRVVKGVCFQELRELGSPVELALDYQKQGADEIVFLDVSATPEGRGTRLATIEEVRKVLSIPLTVGGGVRTVEDAQKLLQAGADKIAINTAAVENPRLLTNIADRFGSQCTVLALDAASTSTHNWEVVTLSGRRRPGLDAIEWAQRAVTLGAGEILLTSWDRDGTRLGYDLELISAITEAVPVPLIASGGAAFPEHLLDAKYAGAHAVLAASIFHEHEFTVHEIKTFLKNQKVEVRL